ncbi:MAG TPA: hypothetical protein VLX90_02875 [Steroidobacteraceae bacterium]|nr:hypothetical protein [Steroidobacteraceae bacterium]
MNSALSSQAGDRSDVVFRWVVICVQTFFGAWFLIHGLNFFVSIFKQPPGFSVPSHELISALIKSGLFSLVKLIEIVVGVLLLSQCFVPLAIVAAAPVTIVIAYDNLALNRDTFSIVTGVVILAANALMAMGYLDSYRAMLRFNVGLPSLRGIRAFRGEMHP